MAGVIKRKDIILLEPPSKPADCQILNLNSEKPEIPAVIKKKDVDFRKDSPVIIGG